MEQYNSKILYQLNFLACLYHCTPKNQENLGFAQFHVTNVYRNRRKPLVISSKFCGLSVPLYFWLSSSN